MEEANALVAQIETEQPAGQLAQPELRYRADIKQTRFGELFEGIYLRRTILSFTQWFTSYFLTYGFSTWLPTLYVNLGHLPAERGLLLSLISSAIGLVVAYINAGIVDHVGRKPIFVAGFVLATVGALTGYTFVNFLGATGWPILFAGGTMMSVGMASSNLGVYVYTPELYPTRMRAWATAASSSMNRVASFIAPTLVGALLAAKLGIQSVFLMFFFVSLAGLVVMAVLGIETKQRVLEELSA